LLPRKLTAPAIVGAVLSFGEGAPQHGDIDQRRADGTLRHRAITEAAHRITLLARSSSNIRKVILEVCLNGIAALLDRGA
jgi:hypothetical protein